MKMKLVVFWVWFLVMFLATSADTSFSVEGGRTKASTETRKLKEESYEKGTSSHDLGKVNLDDYNPPDPPPSSGVITSGPIEYGTPLIPHIPKPKPGNDSNSSATYPPSPSPVQSPPENL